MTDPRQSPQCQHGYVTSVCPECHPEPLAPRQPKLSCSYPQGCRANGVPGDCQWCSESPLGDKLCQSCGSSACCNEQANRGAPYPDSPDVSNTDLMARIDDLEAERDALLAQIRECGENRTAEAKRCADAEAERDALRGRIDAALIVLRAGADADFSRAAIKAALEGE